MESRQKIFGILTIFIYILVGDNNDNPKLLY
ncbi:hypothetical protein SAMN05421866_0829 [Chryseobacterium oranimense]|uniref:Uncharacterized protein n=1 Tax=Chryseobacterium oranimense TaxID=421058 RepID=A0A1M5KTC8_9FLAO|nr:hypothetical protein SAMN05421866_0829 [Chryseobacterium oranimense]